MSSWLTVPMAAGAAGVAGLAAAIWRRKMHVWLPAYLAQRRSMPRVRLDRESVHVFISVCDHYEPEWGRPGRRAALERVERWREAYPRIYRRFEDCAGRPPQHTFFYPADEYAPDYLDELGQLCAAGFGDVEVHLHHDGDTADSLCDTLESYKHTLSNRHGLLRRDPITGEIVYGFIHGNWALCNSRPDGRWCGVDRELTVLRDTGCYADFTMPSAPADCQTPIINSIYYATERGRRSNDRGTRAQVGRTPPDESLLLVQGPLGLNWRDRKWGLLPRLENADIHSHFPPTWTRMQAWLDAGVRVEGRPDWVFVKLHTHGAKPGNLDLWLGDRVARFHEELAKARRELPAFHYYYVTAWEMAQLVHAAEAGMSDPRTIVGQPFQADAMNSTRGIVAAK